MATKKPTPASTSSTPGRGQSQGCECVDHHPGLPPLALLAEADDKVDSLPRAFIAQKEGVDSTDAHGSEVMADLARRIRPLKELLFSVGQLEYTLSDGTVGEVFKDSFLADPKVLSFSKAMEAAFVKALESVSDSCLAWLSRAPMRLNVVVTGVAHRSACCRHCLLIRKFLS